MTKSIKAHIDLSIVIPTFEEELSVKDTLVEIYEFLDKTNINFEILVVDDNSNDNTQQVVKQLTSIYGKIVFLLNDKQKGFGNSILKGITESRGTHVAIMMADKSDSVQDLLSYYMLMESDSDLDCVFGSRWMVNGPEEYPILKRLINRLGNKVISFLFSTNYNDFTNSFKLYKRKSIEEVSPILSNHFSITLELPLKMIVRGFKYKVVPNTWKNREHGVSKLQILNIIKTYSLVIIYCLIDKYFWKKRYVSSK